MANRETDFCGCQITVSFADGFASKWTTADGSPVTNKEAVVARLRELYQEQYPGAATYINYAASANGDDWQMDVMYMTNNQPAVSDELFVFLLAKAIEQTR